MTTYITYDRFNADALGVDVLATNNVPGQPDRWWVLVDEQDAAKLRAAGLTAEPAPPGRYANFQDGGTVVLDDSGQATLYVTDQSEEDGDGIPV